MGEKMMIGVDEALNELVIANRILANEKRG